MKKIKELIKNPLYLILIVLGAILLYLFLNDCFYVFGEKLGKELIDPKS